MSMPSSSVKSVGSNFIDSLPPEAMWEIFGWLDDKTLIDTTARVCKGWENSTARAELLPEARRRIRLDKVHRQMIESKYPEVFRQMFRDCGKPIDKLPVLELSQVRDYIDFLDPEDLSYSVMRFKDQLWSRPGIAFSLQRKESVRDRGVVTIFKRHFHSSRWEFGHKESLRGFWTDAYVEETGEINPEFIRALLSDQHPVYKIV